MTNLSPDGLVAVAPRRRIGLPIAAFVLGLVPVALAIAIAVYSWNESEGYKSPESVMLPFVYAGYAFLRIGPLWFVGVIVAIVALARRSQLRAFSIIALVTCSLALIAGVLIVAAMF